MELNTILHGRQISRADFLRGAVWGGMYSAALGAIGCSQSRSRPTATVSTPDLRVLICENKTQTELRADGGSTTLRAGGGPTRQIAIGSDPLPLTLSQGTWSIGGQSIGAGVLFIDPPSEGGLLIDRHAYRGRYRCVPKPSGKFDVVNDVDVERYLLGVVAREMFPNWHEAAYRAQAIVARTYALYVARTASDASAYDLTADTRSQVYGGITGETTKSRTAVDATRGLVVASGAPGNERIFKAYFSSCCGGVTQSAAAAFGDPPLEALSEQETGCCSASPRYTWAPIAIAKSEITRRVRRWGVNNSAPERDIGDISRIDIMSSNRFGRPESFALTDARGYRYRLGSEDMRLAVDTDATDGVRLPSSFCKPVNEPAAIRFMDGRGFGHGVGLCQWCAQFQALAGQSHTQIVLAAYPKAVIVAAY